MSRHYLKLEEYGISKPEQKELKYFFLSYPVKKRKIKEGSNIKLKNDVEKVEKAVRLACGEDTGMYEPLLQVLTGSTKLDNLIIPCSHSTLYEYRKKAYYYLFKIK